MTRPKPRRPWRLCRRNWAPQQRLPWTMAIGVNPIDRLANSGGLKSTFPRDANRIIRVGKPSFRSNPPPPPPERVATPFAPPPPPPPPADASPKEKMAYKLKTELGRAIYRLRKCTVEPVIGIIKEVLGVRQFSLGGLRAATGEWCLVCFAFNLKRLHVLWPA